MSFRKLQIESLLKRVITEVLIRRVSDPRIVGMVSVTQVDVSPDLSQATVHVSVLPQRHEKTTVAGLNHAGAYIHGLVRKAVSLRTVPHLTFRLDKAIKKEAAVLEAIHRGLEREGQPGDASPDDADNTPSPATDSTPGSPARSTKDTPSGETSGGDSGGTSGGVSRESSGSSPVEESGS